MTDVSFTLNEDGDHVWWSHDCTDPIKAEHGSRLCVNTMLPNAHAYWTITQRDPLTLTPSILCTACQCHGFITNGEWVPV